METHQSLVYKGWLGDWAATVAGLVVLSFIGAALVLSAEPEQQTPRSIVLRSPDTATQAIYIYDAPQPAR